MSGVVSISGSGLLGLFAELVIVESWWTYNMAKGQAWEMTVIQDQDRL